MLTQTRRLLAAGIIATAAGFVLAPLAHAQPPTGIMMSTGDGVMAHDAWARASAGAATTGGVYITLMGGNQADTLIGASTPVANLAEVHETINDHGIMKMRAVPGGVPVAPHQSLTFSPGGYHVMLTGLKQPLTAGQTFPLTLTFTHAAPITVQVTVRALGQKAPMDGGDHMKM